MQTFRRTRFYNNYRDRDTDRDNWRSTNRNDYSQDNYKTTTNENTDDVGKQLTDLIKEQRSTNAFVKETYMDLKTKFESITKNHQASIRNLESKFERLADKQSNRPSGSLPSNTQPNPRNNKPYQPPQARNEHVNAVFTCSGKTYDPPTNPNDKPTEPENLITFDSDEDEESITKTKPKDTTPEKPEPKPYKPKIPYPQRLRKERM